jgi:hypothetical protein
MSTWSHGLPCVLQRAVSAWAFVLTNAWALERLALAQRSDLAGVVYAGIGLGMRWSVRSVSLPPAQVSQPNGCG